MNEYINGWLQSCSCGYASFSHRECIVGTERELQDYGERSLKLKPDT